MDGPQSTVDPLVFIASAKSRMGDIDESGSLAQVFSSQATGTQPNFWQIGCAFDTILDYFLALKESGQMSPADGALMAQLTADAATGYQYGIVGLAAAWYDDWCWWGIAASKAFDPDYEEIFGDQLEFFQSAAIDLWGLVDSGAFAPVADSIPAGVWKQAAGQSNGVQFSAAILSARAELHTGTRNAWALIERGATGTGTPRQNADYAAFTAQGQWWAVPRFAGGCWQYDLSASSFPCNDGPWPFWEYPNPVNQTLGPFQVTLMQGLYLNFCCSLLAAAGRAAAEKKSGGAWDRLQPAETYRQSADAVIAFLADWVELPQPDSLATPFAQGALFHERPATYGQLQDGSYPPLQGYHSDAYWAGDQGLVMGALEQYAQLGGALPASLQGMPALLLAGMFYNMPATDGSGAVGWYRDPSGTSPIVGDSNDYGSGSGIFWRYVMRCCRLDPDFARQARADPTIVGTATTSGTGPNHWGNTLFVPFNGVAAGIGAWYLLG